MADSMSFKDRQFFRALPILVSYIKTGKRLTDDEVKGFVKMFPDHSHMLPQGRYDKMLDMAIKYKDDETYGTGIKVMLSPEGRVWLADFFDQLERLRKEME